MITIFAQKALLASGWADNVQLTVSGGIVHRTETADSSADADYTVDCVIPGLCNAHSHAFQRALAGWTEERSPGQHENFWSWRERMYALAERVDATRLQVIAQQAYVEMLSRGYTTVAEFHYLHRPSSNNALDDAMFDAIRTAASESGIRLTYVPVLYEQSGFDQTPPAGAQQLFALDSEVFLEHFYRCRDRSDELLTVAIGAHSIRAVSQKSLAQVTSVANSANVPMHIHIAEQPMEVEQALAVYERRPVQWLLENFDVGTNWCLVHATHMNTTEIADLAATGAVVCLCPSTEANLGDGLFPLANYLRQGGDIAIGSDSQISINPFEELRWLEYGQRLAANTRNVVSLRGHHVGHELFHRVLEGGSRAAGQHSTGITSGGVADLVTLRLDDPMLAAHNDANRLDALVFSGFRLPIDSVMVGGEWRVRNGMHVDAAATSAAYVDVANSIAAAGLV